MVKISIVVPFYNEEIILRKKIVEIHAYLKKNFSDFEIIFVDDGSSDASRNIVTSYSKLFANLHIITYKKNSGRGFALTQGFNKASGEIIGYVDCDLEIKLKYIIPAITQLKRHDVVIASKFRPKSRVKTPFIRKVSSVLYNRMVQLLLNTRISDHQAGFKFFHKNVIKSILPVVEEKGWLWDAEVLYLVQKKNYTVYELPISIKYGYRKIRNSFFLDFFKLPMVFIKLRRRIDRRFRIEHLHA